MKILIIGYGVVGQNMQKVFPDAVIHDPKRGMIAGRHDYDIAFVCVPTPKCKDGSADTIIVESVFQEWDSAVRVFVIKSTVPPGTTESLNDGILTMSRAIFSPEYFGGTQHANHVGYDFVILGGCNECCNRVAEAYKEVSTAKLRILYTDAKTAELVKYGENAFLYMKVAFVNEFARICKAFDVDFDQWRELWLADPRINRSHTFVYREHPYVESHCLDKDIPAIIKASESAGYKPCLLYAMAGINNVWKQEGPLW